MQLELKHISPYLPYKLKMLDGWGNIKTMTCYHLDDENNGFIVMIKPILRPLSDLTREIEHNGERFVPIEYISTSKAVYQRIMRRVCNEQSLDNLEYWQAERLFELHFDIFNLIPNGIAIDINEINK